MKSMYFKPWQSRLESKDGVKKWFPRLVKKKRVVTTWEIASKISKKASLTPADVIGVFDAAVEAIGDELMDGYTVKIDRFGTFTAIANAKGRGVDTSDEVNSSQIGNLRVRFTPAYTRTQMDGTTRSMFAGVTFERIDVAEKDGQDNDQGSGGSGSGDPNA